MFNTLLLEFFKEAKSNFIGLYLKKKMLIRIPGNK